jgi:hypothetical protein
MEWTEEKTNFLVENYSKNIPLEDIAKSLNRTIKAVKRKAERLHLSRPRFPFNKPSNKTPKKIIDRRYYLKHKKEVYARKINRRKRLKEEMVKVLGGGCKFCGYNKCCGALDFHHIKENKDEGIASLIKNASKQKILKELEKCILLCANCHRELHTKGV